MDEDVELAPILDDLATRPPLDLSYSQDTEARLPAVLGGRTVALARSFKVLDPVEEFRHERVGTSVSDLRPVV